MATKNGSWGWHSGSDGWRSVLVYSTSETDTTYTISTTLQIEMVGEYGIEEEVIRGTVTIGTGSGSTSTKTMPSSTSYPAGTKTTILSKSRTYTKGSSTQSVAVSCTVVDVGMDETSTVSASFTVPQRTYDVKYNANGGDTSSVPATQKKIQGTTLKLSTTIPTRSGCTFLGWCTDKNGVGVNYDPGSNYTANAAVTLYAIWLGVSVPTIECERTDSEGAESDEGTYGTLAASWQAIGSPAADVTVTATNVTTGASITLDGDTTGSKAAQKSVTGNVSALFGADEGQAGALDADTRYTIRVTVTATAKNAYSGQTVTARATAYVAYAYISMDFRVGGHGVSFGKTAVRDGFDVAMTPIYLGAAPTHDTDRSTSNAVNIITPNATDVTVTAAQAKTWGKVAQVYVRFTNKADLSVPASGNITNLTVGTLADAFRPAMVGAGQSYGDNAGQCWYYLSAGGEIQLGAVEGTGAARTIAAGTTFNCCLTYILA